MRCASVGPEGEPARDIPKEPSGNWSKLPNWLDLGRDKKQGATWPHGNSAIAWDGENSVVVWQRYHLCGEKYTNFENCDVVAARVDGWAPVDDPGAPVAASEADEKWPAVASDGEGSLLLVYERHGPGGEVLAAARALATK